MSAKQQTWAGSTTPATSDCHCNSNHDSPIESVIVNKMAETIESKLAKLAVKKRWLALANQIRLAKLKLVNLRHEMPCKIPTINNLPRHTRTCTFRDINK